MKILHKRSLEGWIRSENVNNRSYRGRNKNKYNLIRENFCEIQKDQSLD